MAKLYQSGFELHTKVDKSGSLKAKTKPFKHEKGCDGKILSESTKHFTFIAACKCKLKYKVDDEQENRN